MNTKQKRKVLAVAKIAEIESEMQRIGFWSDQPLPPDKYQFKQAFGMDKLTYSQWLQFIFIPRVRDLATNDEPFPAKSRVGTQAIREFDGLDEASGLTSLLCEFDALFGDN